MQPRSIQSLSPPLKRSPMLTFSPLAWLKLLFFCHAGDTEISGFGIAAANDLLYVEDFRTVRQQATPVSVRFFDDAVADFYDQQVDAGLPPARFARLWIHTHPADSVTPSSVDEGTFARTFGRSDWAVMAILGRTGRTYARLAFQTGPGGPGGNPHARGLGGLARLARCPWRHPGCARRPVAAGIRRPHPTRSGLFDFRPLRHPARNPAAAVRRQVS